MKKKLFNYIEYVEEEIKNKNANKELKEDMLTKISFFQHERLIHLIVTFMTAVGMVLFMLGFLVIKELLLFALFLLTLILFFAYILHYYNLENGVQKLYNLYDQIKTK